MWDKEVESFLDAVGVNGSKEKEDSMAMVVVFWEKKTRKVGTWTEEEETKNVEDKEEKYKTNYDWGVLYKKLKREFSLYGLSMCGKWSPTHWYILKHCVSVSLERSPVERKQKQMIYKNYFISILSAQNWWWWDQARNEVWYDVTQYLNGRITSSTEHYLVVKTWMIISSEPDNIVCATAGPLTHCTLKLSLKLCFHPLIRSIWDLSIIWFPGESDTLFVCRPLTQKLKPWNILCFCVQWVSVHGPNIFVPDFLRPYECLHQLFPPLN